MGEDYTYDDYESIIETYDMGEVCEHYYVDDDYDQVGHYEQLADRYCAWINVSFPQVFPQVMYTWQSSQLVL